MQCAAGGYKAESMSACEPCPAHTHDTENRTRYAAAVYTVLDSCKLYDAYDFDGRYVFNLIKFDRALKDGKKLHNLFGPFSSGQQDSTIYFFSPEATVDFAIDTYEYEEDVSMSIQQGHVFGLVSAPTASGRTHSRIKRNMGSKLGGLWFSPGNFTVEYVSGDICEGRVRFKSYISFVCDTSAPTVVRTGEDRTRIFSV